MLISGFNEDFIGSLINETLETTQMGPRNITRHFMYTRLYGILERYDGCDRKCLSISHSANFSELPGLSQAVVAEANYPEHNMLCLDFPVTPDALRLLAEHCNTTVLECGGWGDKEAWSFINLGFRWTQVPVRPSHPIHGMVMSNDDSAPIVTWVVSQKE